MSGGCREQEYDVIGRVEPIQPLSTSKVKASSYIAQYPVLRTIQRLYFPDRPVHSDTILASLGSIQPYATIMREVPIASYSFIQLSELEQCRVNKLAQCFNTAAQDSNPGSRSRESEALHLSHCALQAYIQW